MVNFEAIAPGLRRVATGFAALLLLLLGAQAALAQNFPELTGRVVDAAKLLSPEQVAQLTALSEDVEKSSSRQFVVATIPDLQGYDIADYGYKLGRAWKIGQAEANNGILLIVAPNEKKVRIEVGYGLEPIMPDGLAGSIIQEQILPKFRDGDMPGGILAGAQAIAEQMKLPLEAAEARAKQKADSAKKNKKDSAGIFVAIFFGIVVMIIGISAIAAGSRRGRRYGGGSGIGQVLLWTAIDAALRSGGSRGGSSWGGGSDWGGGGGGGFSGGGGSFGGGGASGSW